MTRVGFVGLGNMGGAMAVNIARAGHDTVVYDVSDAAVASVVERAPAARAAASLAEVAEHADVIDVVVVDDAQVEAVALGGSTGGGLVELARPGAVLAVHSTVHPETVRRVAAAARAASRGVDVLDAPISGGIRGATDATLCIMVGGPAPAFERAKPVFDSAGNFVLHLGDVGAGLAAKLARNLIGYVTLLGAAEGLRLATAAGVDLEVLQQILDHTGTLSPMMRDFLGTRGGHSAYAEDLAPLIAIWNKDMRVALDLAADVGVELPVSEATAANVDVAIDAMTTQQRPEGEST